MRPPASTNSSYAFTLGNRCSSATSVMRWRLCRNTRSAKLLSNCSKCLVEIFGGADVELLELDSQCLSGDASLPHRRNVERIDGIVEHGDTWKGRCNFARKLQPLAFKIRRDRTQPGQIA